MPPGWIVQTLRWLTIGVLAVFAGAMLFAAIVMPYRLWDSLAFGSWSRSIAETGSLRAGTEPLNASRPLFYVPQGLLWRYVTEEEWVGRLLSLAFAALLVASVWLLARQLAHGAARTFLAPLAVGVVLSSAALATYAAAGMTDVPVAGASAATAVVLWSSFGARFAIPLAALGAAATVLAKPSGLLALAGLAVATVVLRGRRASWALAGAGGGVVIALAYDTWQAARLDVALSDLLRAGNDDFWLERGAAARWEVLASAGWIGDGARLLVLYGLAYGIARIASAGARVALGAAAGVALGWSVFGPVAAGNGVGYPFDGSVPGVVAWLALAAVMVAAALFAEEDPLPRRTYAALLLWLAPIGLVWASQRPDEVRLLAPAWPAFALLSGAALTVASLALLRRRELLAIAPMTAVALVAVTNVVSVDGLGRDGWRQLIDLGPSGWRDDSEMENFAYGPFSYHLNLARENVGPDDRIVSSDGRLRFFFPGQVDVEYARTCGELEGARFFSFLTSGESLELAELGQQPTDPIGWLQCEEPSVELVGEQSGIYAAFVLGGRPARPPTPEDCRITPVPGELLDAVFGNELSYADAAALQARALEVGFTGTKLERTGCSTFRVVVTGVPEDEAVQADFARQAEGVGLPVEYEAAIRYPEVAAGIPPVASR
jgi:hypothetical protein